MTKRSEQNGARVVADALRAEVPVLDELTRARLEKRVVEAAVGGSAGASAMFGSRGRRLAVGAGILGLAAAAVVLVAMRGGAGSGTGAPETLAAQSAGPGTATFEAMGGEQPVRRGVFGEGEAIETRGEQRMLVRFAQSRIEVTPETRARFARLRTPDVRIALEIGRVEVAFHPLHRGAEHLTIDTPSARIEVVGTEFTVEHDAAGTTTVRVSEGVVRVVPLDGSAPRLVQAGKRTRVIAAGAGQSTGGTLAGADALVVPDVEPVAVSADESAPAVATGESAAGESGVVIAAGAHAPIVAAGEGAIVDVAPSPVNVAALLDAPAVPPTAEERFAAASRLYHLGQLEQAAEALLPMAHDARMPRSVRRDASNLLGDIYKGWLRQDDAADEYERACDLGSAESCYSLGGVRMTLDDHDRARIAYQTYLRRAPSGPLAQQARARLCRPLGVSEACFGSVVTPYAP